VWAVVVGAGWFPSSRFLEGVVSSLPQATISRLSNNTRQTRNKDLTVLFMVNLLGIIAF
jgi:hypothetical protein